MMKYLGGAVAQLGARLDGIEEVVGSNPIGSTNVLSKRVKRVVLLPVTEPALFTRNRVFGWRRLFQHGSARQGFGL
jgi:hypothetical protein